MNFKTTLLLILALFLVSCDRNNAEDPTPEPEGELVNSAELEADTTTDTSGDSGSIVPANTFRSAISADGQLEAQRQANLSLTIAGNVDQVLVQIGDQVSEGDLLVQMENEVLLRNVAVARQNLLIQEANLALALAESTPEDVVSAEIAVASAQAFLDNTTSGPTDEAVAAAEASVRAADSSIFSASAQRNQVTSTAASAEAISAAEATLRAANASVNAAWQQLETVKGGPTADAIANAQASVKSAEAGMASAWDNLQNIKDGPTAEQIAQAEASLSSAESGVASAQQNLDNAQKGPTQTEIINAETNLINAQQQQKAAQDYYDAVFTCYEQDDGYLYCPREQEQQGATTNLELANQQLAAAQAALQQLLAGPDPQAVNAAWAAFNSATDQRNAAQAQLDALLAGNDSDAVQNAQAAYNSAVAQRDAAQTSLNTLLNGSTEATVQNALAGYNNAIAQRDSAQDQLDKLLAGPDVNSVASANASIASAVANRDSAQANLDTLLLGSNQYQIVSAESQLAQAEAALANLLRGPKPEQIAVYEAQIEQAKLSLAEAEAALANATLIAPFDGVVTVVMVREGENASGLAIELVDFGSLQMVVNVDEIDIGFVRVGQEASVFFKSYPTESISADVISISPTATSSTTSALVTYKVNLRLADNELPLRLGMTGKAQLVTE